MNLEFLVTRSIYENPKISQRALSKKLFTSLGKINSTLNKLINDGMIEKNDKTAPYKVTSIGLNELKKHKVDGALILASGIGIRLAPLTYDTPKCFIKINGERMIERQIEQIKAAGVNDITIMVGFMKEKFEYLIDKYNVKLIYNEEYRTKNTLSTFVHAIDVLKKKNMYVCVADVYMNENIYHKYEADSYYTSAFYEDCKSEWRCKTNSKREILDYYVGGKNDFCIVGPAFLKKDFIDAFIPYAKDAYQKSSTNNYYWEDVWVQNLDKLPRLCLYKLEDNIIYEFDSIEDINAFSKTHGGYGSESISFAARALNIDESEMKDIVCVKEGMTNHSYRFKADGEEYIARVPGEDTGAFINRKIEGQILNGLKGTGITEDIIYFDDEKGYKLAKFFKNARPINIHSDQELKKAMMLYKKFHLSGIKVDATCSLTDKVNEYLNIIKNKRIYIPYEDFDETIKKAKLIENFVSIEDKNQTLCHGDSNPGNILITNDGIKMIDFEYGGMANPLTDIAQFGAYVKYDIDETFKLYKMYKEVNVEKDDSKIIPKSDDIAKKVIIAFMALGGLYNAVWAIVREGLSNVDYGTYGMRGYRLFKNCYKKLNL